MCQPRAVGGAVGHECPAGHLEGPGGATLQQVQPSGARKSPAAPQRPGTRHPVRPGPGLWRPQTPSSCRSPATNVPGSPKSQEGGPGALAALGGEWGAKPTLPGPRSPTRSPRQGGAGRGVQARRLLPARRVHVERGCHLPRARGERAGGRAPPPAGRAGQGAGTAASARARRPGRREHPSAFPPSRRAGPGRAGRDSPSRRNCARIARTRKQQSAAPASAHSAFSSCIAERPPGDAPGAARRRCGRRVSAPPGAQAARSRPPSAATGGATPGGDRVFSGGGGARGAGRGAGGGASGRARAAAAAAPAARPPSRAAGRRGPGRGGAAAAAP